MTRLAKIIYWLSGKLSKIQTLQQTYAWNEKTDAFDKVARKVRLPCVLSMRALGWSMYLDPNHWDHWAVVHDHKKDPCSICHGCRCDN